MKGVPPWHAEYDTLYREHFARVTRLCRLLLNDAEEAQDVAQEVFLKLARAHEEPKRPTAWAPWLTRVTVNACRDRRRSWWWQWSQKRREDLGAVELTASDPTPDRAALNAELSEDIWRAFRRLPRRQREVFVLRQIEGVSTQDAAGTLGLTTGSVKRHLFRAVQQLRKALGERS